MRRKGSECTRISPAEARSGGKPMIALESRSSTGRRAPSSGRNERPRQVRGACGPRVLRSARWTAARFYRRARNVIVRAFRPASSSSTKKRATAHAASSPDCTPARNSSKRQQAAPVVADDSHKSEAVEECIKFMNSSSRKYR